MNYLRHISLSLLLLVPFSPVAAEPAGSAEGYHRIALSAGELGLADKLRYPGRYGIEYQARPYTSWKLIPAIGFAWAESGANLTYAAVRRDFWLTDRWSITPTTGLGAFQESEELKLGSELEFRSGIEAAYNFRNHYRLGLGFFHVSNAGIGERNPGSESLIAFFAVPFR